MSGFKICLLAPRLRTPIYVSWNIPSQVSLQNPAGPNLSLDFSFHFRELWIENELLK